MNKKPSILRSRVIGQYSGFKGHKGQYSKVLYEVSLNGHTNSIPRSDVMIKIKIKLAEIYDMCVDREIFKIIQAAVWAQ